MVFWFPNSGKNFKNSRLFAILALFLFQTVFWAGLAPEIKAASPAENQPQPATLKNATFENRLQSGETLLSGLVSLSLADPRGAEEYAREVQDPFSPYYGQFLTPPQFLARFGPSETNVSQVKAYLQEAGFEVEREGLLLSLKGEQPAFERTFNVQLNNYSTQSGDQFQSFFSADREPLVANALKPYVQSVQLHNRPLHNQTMVLSSPAQTAPPQQPLGLNPAQIRKAYNIQPLIDAGTRGQGQIVAIVQLTTYNQNDIKTYADQFGISGYQIQDIQVNSDEITSRGAGEAALDIEITLAVAPQVTVLVYQAGNNLPGLEKIYSRIISDNRAPISSSSWGQCENYFNSGELDTLHSLFIQGIAQGHQFFAASGDSGAFDCNNQANQYPQKVVDYPASDPNVIGVGGSSLQVDASGTYLSESAWANSSDKTRSATGSGSGGGLSLLYNRPAYQDGPGVQNQYSNGKRQVPDLSANSDPSAGYAIYCTVTPGCSPYRPWVRVGGTSASAPLIAAAATLVNQYNNKRVVTLPRLYQLASQPQAFASYNDIVSGNNLYYPTTPGYDLATGLGSPNVFNIARNLGEGQPAPGQVAAPPPASSLIANPAGFADTSFADVWSRTDKLVVAGKVLRTWLWGQQPLNGASEPYAEAPGGQRQVQYFDKSRMEINNPGGDHNSPYYVTNGLLARELITGQIQTGNNSFTPKGPALIGVAGDPDDKLGPTYANLNQYQTAVPFPLNTVITATINRNGDLGTNGYFGQYSITNTAFIRETNHTIAKPFWDYLNSTGPVMGLDGRVTTGPLFNPTFYATGFPISEPYWCQVKVAGQVKDVLVQAFERRVLTYTPANAPEWRVEMGNVGQHYYRWRYGG